ncbi:MAG: hypothetical protein R2690_11775 [Acidimicrobiales bacterium]
MHSSTTTSTATGPSSTATWPHEPPPLPRTSRPLAARRVDPATPPADHPLHDRPAGAAC